MQRSYFDPFNIRLIIIWHSDIIKRKVTCEKVLKIYKIMFMTFNTFFTIRYLTNHIYVFV